MKQVPTSRLIDDGLIFEINRQVLNPMGLALAVVVNPSNQSSPETVVLMETDDDEGVLFSSEKFEDGAARFSSFFKRTGEDRVTRRMRTLGFIRQTRSDQ